MIANLLHCPALIGAALIFAAFFNNPTNREPRPSGRAQPSCLSFDVYSLPCASPLAKLYKLDTTEVDHFELLDDNRKLISSFNVTNGIGNVM